MRRVATVRAKFEHDGGMNRVLETAAPRGAAVLSFVCDAQHKKVRPNSGVFCDTKTMFNRWKKQDEEIEAPPEIRDTLFGDLPLAQWPLESAEWANQEPWSLFARARNEIVAGNQSAAIQILQHIAVTPKLESRHYLQAWHFLREMGVTPEGTLEKQILGVIVEAGLPGGLDIVAAYADCSARYFNFSGAAVIWEQPDNSLDELIRSMLQNGAHIAEQIGPWEDARPPAPTQGQLRINMLTPSGLHFGQGEMQALIAEPLARPTFDSALQLMQALIAKTEN